MIDPVQFEDIEKAEKEWIAKRRVIAGVGNSEKPENTDSEKTVDDLAGLALSGGGIRSAVFNLGLLQALEGHGLLKNIDVLSTVSGGGYIGSCLTWLKSIRPGVSPFGTSREHYSGTAGIILSWLRSHGKYLSAGDGLSAWSLTAALLTGTLINLLVIIPPLFLLIFMLTRDIPYIPANIFNIEGIDHVLNGRNDGFSIVAIGGITAFASFVVITAIYVLSSSLKIFRNHKWQREMRVWQGRLLMFGCFFLVIGTIPVFHGQALNVEYYVLSNLDSEAGSWTSIFDEFAAGVTFLTGLLTMVLAKPKQSKEVTVSNARKIIFSAGLTMLIYGLFLMGFDLMKDLSDPNTEEHSILNYDESMAWSIWYQAALGCSVFLALFVNVNDVSMHRYYRNRLMEAFMPVVGGDTNDVIPEPDTFELHRAEPVSDSPYHIINTSVNMVGSRNIKLQGRGAENFILSSLYCGSESCGYAATQDYEGGNMDLATAFSISGAAIDPNSYATRSRSVSFLMSLLNIRLGYWIRNPRFPKRSMLGLSRPQWYVYLLREMLGAGLNENVAHVHLSDGGHFENLGLYELVRRRCKYIIVSDVGADPDYSFQCLAKIIEMVRVDFGASINLESKELEPKGEKRLSETAFVQGTVHYSGSDDAGMIIYIKPVLISDMPEDIHGYRRNCPDFPHESTANQFFNETQFEAYRELGYQIGKRLCLSGESGNLASLFQTDSKASSPT